MVLEVTILNIKQGFFEAFENQFQSLQCNISFMKGYISRELKKCIEQSIGTYCWFIGRIKKALKLGLENQINIKNEKPYGIIFINLFQR